MPASHCKTTFKPQGKLRYGPGLGRLISQSSANSKQTNNHADDSRPSGQIPAVGAMPPPIKRKPVGTRSHRRESLFVLARVFPRALIELWVYDAAVCRPPTAPTAIRPMVNRSTALIRISSVSNAASTLVSKRGPPCTPRYWNLASPNKAKTLLAFTLV